MEFEESLNQVAASDSPFDSFVGERLILFFDRFRRRALNKFTLFFFDKEVADVTSNDF